MRSSSSRVIGIDGSRLSVADRTGTETYTAQIIRHLAPISPPDYLRVYLRGNADSIGLERMPQVEVRPLPDGRLWTHRRLSNEMWADAPDVLFVPAHVVPVVHPATVVTIHDLGFVHHPNGHPPAQRRVLDLTTRWSAKVAHHIIAISETTKRDLVGAYGVSPAKITVIHHGVDHSFRPRHPKDIAEVRQRLGLPERYILTVGTVQPRKNLANLAAAMKLVVAAGLPHRLVIAGKTGWLASGVEREIAAYAPANSVIRLGYVATADLPMLYAGADAFALPSYYEGFGLPALEALATGLPSLVSDRSALPEVVGDAALLVNPTDVEAIGAALVRLITDQATRRRLTATGPIQAARFSWTASAAATMDVLRRTIDQQAR